MHENSPERSVQAFFDSLSESETLSGATVLAAVSGGSDSVAMLCLLHSIAPRYGFFLRAVTVNHMIRSREESSGDASFVEELCAKLVPPVPCTVVALAAGEVTDVASARGKGIEDAARHLRYGHFSRHAAAIGAAWICTGHTRNDQLETVLMRFLQGSGGSSLAGIARRREIFLRPVIDCTREELSGWLTAQGFGWREDATNGDDRYFRNRVRRHLVPLLDAQFPGWDSGILAASGRARTDDLFCRSMIETRWQQSGNRISCDIESFASMHPALRLRFLYDGLSLLEMNHRVSAAFLDRIVHIPELWREGSEHAAVEGSGLCCVKDGTLLFLGPDIVQNTKSGYLVSISAPGKYRLPSGIVAVSERDEGLYLDDRLGPFSSPIVLRSRSGGDTVRTADGRQKTLKKLMNDWSVTVADRDRIPVVEQNGEIRAVYGSVLGYSDWYVHTRG